MREFEVTFNSFNGLRAFKHSVKPGLLECYNLMPGGDEGLLPYEPILQLEPLAPACGLWIVDEWPWPKVFFGSKVILGFALADAHDCGSGIPNYNEQIVLYEMTNDGNWSVEAMKSLGFSTNIDQINVVDFGYFYVVSAFGYLNQNPNIFCVARILDTVKPNAQYNIGDISSFPPFISGCNFNGQAVVGGIKSINDIWSDRKLYSICWSGIGNFDFNPFNDVTAGFVDLPWTENEIIYSVRKLGNQVVVFGSGGVVALHPVSDPVSTFGIRNLSLPGIRSGNHVAGDDNLVGWVDINNDFWLMDGTLKSKKLGYQEWISELDNGDIVVSFLSEKKRFYIATKSLCYVLSEFGLSSCHQKMTSVGKYQDDFYGFFLNTLDYEWRLETTNIDFKQRGFKTLQSIEIHGIDEYVSGKVKFKSRISDENYQETDWKSFNPNGILSVIVSGSDFKFCVSGNNYLTTRGAQEIKLRLKQTDKRNIRGLYNANPNIS